MKLSTKGRYGLKAMIHIAVYGAEKNISIKSIAEKQNISENYLEQIIPALKKAGLLKSTRGAYGGYKLLKEASKIKAGDILRALEGPLSPVCCIDEKEHDCKDDCTLCVSKTLWEKMRDSLNDAADSITLEDLATNYYHVNKLGDVSNE